MSNITQKKLGKLLDFIDSLEKLSASDWLAIYEACADYDIPFIKPKNLKEELKADDK
mgnify:CR=1 FL=1